MHNFSAADFSWNEFVHQGMTFWAPTLDPFLGFWGHDVAVLYRKYVESSSGDRVYSARVVVPGSGHVVEIVSRNVSDPKPFSNYSEVGECPEANHLASTMAELEDQWTKFGGSSHAEDLGLPDLLIAQITMPVANEADTPRFGDFLRTHLSPEDQRTVRSSEKTIIEKNGRTTCAHADTMVSLTLNGSYQVPIRYVYNADAARTEGRSVHVYGTLYTDHLDEVMGCDAAYARYADWHVGIETEATLDYSAARLCANDVGFKNGGTTNLTQLNLTTTAGPFNWTAADANITNAILGSNWCRGTNGLGDDENQMEWCPYDFDEDCDDCGEPATTADDGDAPAVAGTDDVADARRRRRDAAERVDGRGDGRARGAVERQRRRPRARCTNPPTGAEEIAAREARGEDRAELRGEARVERAVDDAGAAARELRDAAAVAEERARRRGAGAP
ncbi:hypothetical protein JL722_13549 [Aureococcus anophagefferens]|nr:hypothetical protein JL722_13549 [Aureococcus anophagefferens]